MYTAQLASKNQIIMFKNQKTWKQKFSLRQGGAPRLELYSEKGAWKNVSIRVDGKELGKIDNMLILNKGVDFNLEDGSILRFEPARGGKANSFRLEVARYKYPRILINGKPIPGSDALKKLVMAYTAIFVLAALDVFVLVLTVPGAITTISHGSSNAQLDKSLTMVIVQMAVLILINIVLGFLVKSMSKIALIFAILLHGSRLIFLGFFFISALFVFQKSIVFNPGVWIVICVYVICLIWMYKGFSAIKELRIK